MLHRSRLRSLYFCCNSIWKLWLFCSFQRWGLWILLVRPKRMLRYRKVCLIFSCLHLIISFDFDFDFVVNT
uniref:Uncharacterized protein n=1 Tax=Helianthus annuus TaxID=4232 RepID=A0A251UWB6_HELAN